MADGDDQKLREFKCELAGLIGRHAAGLEETSISEVLDEYSNTLRGEPPEDSDEPDRHTGGLSENSTVLLQPNSDALADESPTSEVRQDPPTVQVDLDEDEVAKRKLPDAALLKRRSTRKQAPSSDTSSRAPAATRKPTRSKSKARRTELTQDNQDKKTARPPSENASDAPILNLLDQLRPQDASAAHSWKVGDTSVIEILSQVARMSGPSLLEMRAGKRAAKLVLQDGRIHHVQLLPFSEKRSLLAFLHRKGRLNAERAIRIRRHARDQGIIQARALLKTPEFVSKRDVLAGVRTVISRLMSKVFDAKLETADYYQLDALPPALQVTSVPLVRVVFSHVRAAHGGTYQAPRDRLVERLQDMHLSRNSSLLTIGFNDLGLKLHERPLFERVLDKPRAFDIVMRDSPLPRNDTLAILAGLEAVGFLEVRTPGLGATGSSSYTVSSSSLSSSSLSSSSLSSSSLASSSSSGRAGDLKTALARIDAMAARLERDNHFDIFGLHWTAYDAEIDRRYKELAKQFELLSQPLGMEPKDRKRLEKIRTRLKKIYAILCEPERRNNYRRTVVGPAARRKTATKLEALGDGAFRRKSFESALDYYQRLLELNPDHSKAARLLPMLLMRTSGG